MYICILLILISNATNANMCWTVYRAVVLCVASIMNVLDMACFISLGKVPAIHSAI